MSSTNGPKEATSGHGDSTPVQHLHIHLLSYGYKFLIYVAIAWYFAISVTPALLYIDGCSAFVADVFASVVVLPLSAPGLMAEIAWNVSRHRNARPRLAAEYALCAAGVTTLLLVTAHVLLLAVTLSRPEFLLGFTVGVGIGCWFLRPVGLLEFFGAVFLDGVFLLVTAFYVHLGLVFIPVLYCTLSAIHLSSYIMF